MMVEIFGDSASEADISTTLDKVFQLSRELVGQISVVRLVRRPDPVGADITERLHRDAVKLTKQLPNLHISGMTLRLGQRSFELPQYRTLELRHQYPIKVE
jgi:hypothetical protein